MSPTAEGNADDTPSCFSGLKGLWRKDRSSHTDKKTDELPPKPNAAFTSISPAEAVLLEDEKISPPSYCLKRDDVYRPEILETIKETVNQLDRQLREVSVKIHDHPELGYEEKFAHDTLTAFLSSNGFKITPHYKGLQTAFKAEFVHGTGGRTLGVNSEMDALPGIGHACGHNLIAAAGAGVAIAVKTVLEKHKISGKVVLLGTPAEEGGAGKVVLLDRGAYDEMDLCVMCHPGPGDPKLSSLGSSLALQEINVEFFGHTAHASGAPWEGQNALDAAFVAYSSISALRQQIKPDHRVHGVIQGKDWAPNVIPDYAKMRYLVRAPTKVEVEVLRDRVLKCFEAAALATDCKYETSIGVPHADLRQNIALGQTYSLAMKQLGVSVEPGAARASTDFGNITYALPSLHPHFAVPTEPNGGNHTPAFTAAARTEAAHAAMLEVVKGLAHTGVRALDDDVFFGQVRDTFEGM